MKNKTVNFININTQNIFVDGENLVDELNGEVIAIYQMLRFVKLNNYADSFGFQWNHWDRTLSSIRNPKFGHHEVLIKRTNLINWILKIKL